MDEYYLLIMQKKREIKFIFLYTSWVNIILEKLLEPEPDSMFSMLFSFFHFSFTESNYVVPLGLTAREIV